MKITSCLLILFISIVSTVLSDQLCPAGCFCKSDKANESLIQLDCTRGNFVGIPNGIIPNNTSKLDLSLNSIEIVETIEPLQALTTLLLVGNKINDIQEHAFANINEQLKYLDLSLNQLTENINENIFKRFINLKILNLSHNKIKYLPDKIFDDMQSLEELDLSKNPLTQIPTRVFQQTKSLTKLNLYAIGSYTLKDDQFQYLTKLAYLDLSYNEYKKVPIDGLRSAINLKSLQLNGNLFKHLDDDSFHGLEKLEELSLCENRQLTDIKAESFSGLYNLRKLYINKNPGLSYIDKNAFYNLFNSSWLKLTVIELRDNRLTNLDEDMLPWCFISHVDLTDNQWICDCYFKWIKQCPHSEKIVSGLRCGSPPQLRGLDVALIDLERFECYRNTEKEMKLFRLMVIILGSVMLLFLTILILVLIKRNSIARWCRDRKRANGAIYYVKAQTTPND